MSTYEQRLKAFAESITFELPTEEEVDIVYHTFLNNNSHKVDRFINDDGESHIRSIDKQKNASHSHKIRIF